MGLCASKSANQPLATKEEPKSAVTSTEVVEATPANETTALSSGTASAIATPYSDISNKACFGAGCYWGTEKYMNHDFGKRAKSGGTITKGNVGFMGPKDAPQNPTYKEVCSGSTGHVEVYDLEFTGGEAMYEEMVKFFFQFHDPTTLNQQGNDKGTQYASYIYCYDDKQMEIAQRVKEELQRLMNAGKVPPNVYKGKTVTTLITRSTIFYPAHEEHQDYLMKNPNGYCNHRVRIPEWPTM